MSLKIYFPYWLLYFFHENLGAVSDEHRDSFPQVIAKWKNGIVVTGIC